MSAGTNPPTPAGTTPAGLVETDDSQCATCHSQSQMTTDHSAPTLAAAFNPMTLKINSTSVAAGKLTVSFSITNADGSAVTDLTTLNSAAAKVSGPTDDYQVPATFVTSVNLNTATAAGAAGTYTLDVPLPPEATGGTWAVGLEARRVNPILTARERKLGKIGPTAAAYDFAPVNPVSYFDPTGGGGKITPRRQVVAQESCNACHQILSLHGSLRHTPEYCVLCHAPNATDKPGAGGGATGRPPGTVGATTSVGATIDKLAARSIHLKAMVHLIHTGEELEISKPFVIYGFGTSANFMDEARFPGTRARCEMCHVKRGGAPTYTVDAIPGTAQPTVALQWAPATTDGTGAVTTGGDRIDAQPITAACISCHDAADARAHVQQQQVNLQPYPADVMPPGPASNTVESCGICHGESADFAVTKVHAKFNR